MKEIFSTALAELELFLNNEHLSAREIVDYLRDTPLPFTACFEEELSIDERFHYSFRFLQVLGKYNLPLAVGFCMNQYMAYSIACLPTVAGSPIHILKKDFLQLVKQQRWILAVSSFDDFIRNQSEQAHGVTCVTQVDGSIVCNGVKNFQSNISVADVLLFSAVLDGQKTGLFFTFLKDTPGIILGEPVYTGCMADADTRSVTFCDLQLSSAQMVPAAAEGEVLSFHAFTRVIFSVMAMAPYLGAAARALEEASLFLNSVHLEGQPLANLDGYIVDMGRANIKYQLCEDLIERFTCSVKNLEQHNSDTQNVSTQNLNDWLTSETPKALALKYHVTAVCEELVNQSRKIIGTRAMVSTHIISRLSQQILFAALHPVINAKIERDLGRQMLKQPSLESL